MFKIGYSIIIIKSLIYLIKCATNYLDADECLFKENLSYRDFSKATYKYVLEITRHLYILGKSLKKDHPLINTVLEVEIGDSKFQFILISYNNFAPVYKVVDCGEPKCVLKIEFSSELDALHEKIKYEALCNHNNIVKLIFRCIYNDKKTEKVFSFYYFEYLDVELNLSYCIFNDHQLDESKLKKILRDVVKGLEYIHRAGYVHGDIKFDNILGLRNKDNNEITYKIIDFGLSEYLQGLEWLSSYGNFYIDLYRPPEIIFSIKKKISTLTFKSDIWALGCLAYYLAHGKYPFFVSGNKPESCSRFIAFQKGKDLDLETFSPNLKILILDCLKLNFDFRPSATKLLNEYNFLQEDKVLDY